MAMSPRISGGSPIGGNHITYNSVGGVGAPKPVPEAVPFTSEQLLNADSLLRELEQSRQQVLSAVVVRVMSQLEHAMMDDVLGVRTPSEKALSNGLQSSTWTLLLRLGGKELLIGSDTPFKPGDHVRLHVNAAGQLVLEPSALPLHTDQPTALSLAEKNPLQTAVDDTLRLALPQQELVGVVVQKLRPLLQQLAALCANNNSKMDEQSKNVAQGVAEDFLKTVRTVQSIVEQLRVWQQRMPAVQTLLAQPERLQQQIQQGAVPLEKRIADVLHNMPTHATPDQKRAWLSDAFISLPQQDNKALLLNVLQYVNSLKKNSLGWQAEKDSAAAGDVKNILPTYVGKQTLDAIEKLLHAALSRIVVMQVQDAVENKMQGNTVEQKHPAGGAVLQHFHSDVVLRHGEQFHTVPLHVTQEQERDSQGAVRKGEFVWQVSMDFDLGDMGSLRAVVRASVAGTSIFLQTQNPLLANDIAGKQRVLEERLHKRGIKSVAIRQGVLEESSLAQSLATVLTPQHSFIDVRT